MPTQVLKRRYHPGMSSLRNSVAEGSLKLRRACEECTRSKVRCSGTTPCLLCVKRSCKCVYQPRRKRQKKSITMKRKLSQSRRKPEVRGLQAEMAYRPAKFSKAVRNSLQRTSGIGSTFSSRSTKMEGKDDVTKDVSKTLAGLNQAVAGSAALTGLQSGLSGSMHPQQRKLPEAVIQAQTACNVPLALVAQCGGLNPESITAYATLLHSGQMEKQMLMLVKDMQIGQLQTELSNARKELEKLLKDKYVLEQENKQLKQLKFGQKSVYTEAGKENVNVVA